MTVAGIQYDGYKYKNLLNGNIIGKTNDMQHNSSYLADRCLLKSIYHYDQVEKVTAMIVAGIQYDGYKNVLNGNIGKTSIILVFSKKKIISKADHWHYSVEIDLYHLVP